MRKRARQKAHSVKIAQAIPIIGTGKVLVMFDRSYKHYVFPQGHLKVNETARAAAIREVKEETGFNVIGPPTYLRRFSYSYVKGTKIITKRIQVFAVKLDPRRRAKKHLERHEAYINKILSYSKAIQKLAYDNDIQSLRLALKKLGR